MDVRITVLGGFEVSVDGGDVDPTQWRRRHAAALVKVLALTPNRRLHREQIIDTLWPEVTLDDAAPRLHKAAFYARRAFGTPESVVLAGETVTLFPRASVMVDALQFQASAQTALATGDVDAAGRAADLYSGELLPLDLYESWAQGARDRLRTLYLKVLRSAGRWEVLTTVDPADENAHLQLITSMARRGDHRPALRQFERLERALRQELGVAPSRAAQTLRQQLVQAASQPARSMPASNAPRRDGGSVATAGSPIPAAEPAETTPMQPALVGRRPERARLDDLLDVVAAGQGRTLFISGAPGVGKTALTAWLERRGAGRSLRVGTAAAARIEAAWPYAPVLEALADLSRRHPALLDGLDDTLREEIERGLSGRETGWTAERGHQRLFIAAAELLRLAAAGAGAVLVVDDAQDADEASVRLLHYLARTTVTDRVLIVLAHRPALRPQLAQMRQSLLGRGAAVILDLAALPYDDVNLLVRRHAPAVGASVVDDVWAATGGLPFQVVELARAAAAGRPTARALMSVLPADAQVEVLAAAAVMGTIFDTDEFIEVAALPEDDAYAALDAGIAHGLLVRTDAGYAFRHALLRDAVLGSVPASRHRALHLDAARALQCLHRSPARIGFHLVHGGDQRAAVPWLIRAAETEATLGAYRDALDTLTSVRDHAAGPDLSRLLTLRGDLLMALADADAVDAYREALAATTDPALRSRLRARLARAATFAGDLDTAALALDGLTLDGSPDDAYLLLARGNLALFQGDLEAADAAATQARQRVALGHPEQWQWFDLIGLQGLVAHTRGEWFQRLRVELRRGVRHPELAARIFDSHLCVAEFLLYGPTPYAEVLELAGALRDTAQHSGVLRAVGFATALRGETYLLMGDLDNAEAELLEAADLHRDIGSAAGEAHSLQRLAEARLASGDRAEANQLLHKALPIARFSSVAQHIIQRVYGTMIAAAEDPVAARATVDRAEAAMGVGDRCPFCSIMLAIPAVKACADVGDIDDARGYLAAAERSAVMWEGTAWQAAVLEARAHLLVAEGHAERAETMVAEAADLFAASGQPLDAERCRRPLRAVARSG